jgi:hypothetical protein
MFQPSEYTVITDKNGKIVSVSAPGGMSIPPDPRNSRYQEFLTADTEKKLCARQTVPIPASPGPTLEDRLTALEAGQKTIAAKMGVVIATPITNEIVKGL